MTGKDLDEMGKKVWEASATLGDVSRYTYKAIKKAKWSLRISILTLAIVITEIVIQHL